ncbi:hypothetical protein OPQ81_005100 [Rhizoctonia solani]|nr:hypothetical protein OPQ81_005100 [Rhizoctonia solani]
MSHRRSTSDSTAPIFVAHPLQFAGQGEEEDRYNAAQRYDWDNVPPKLIEQRVPYEPTQPFDYAVPKKIKVLASSENLVAGARRSTRTRKDENTPVVSESELARQLSKKRGRPRRSEASRKTDDGDNTEDESYTEPATGTKRRSQHQPSKRPRVSRNEEAVQREETDEEQDRETAPLRSGGARSRATPIKPQQANRWSNTEDRQLIDSLFEVIGSIPWRRVTAYMAEKGYSCADRGEGAIRGAKRTTETRGETEQGREEKERVGKDAEKASREAAEQAAQDIEDELDAEEAKGEREAEGDTTVEEEDPPAPRRERPRGTGPPKRPKERGLPRPRESEREREQERGIELDQGPPIPPRIPAPPTLHPPIKPPAPGANARSPVPVSPNPSRRVLPSLQSPERTSERNLPLPVPTTNQRSPRLTDVHSPRLPRPPTPPQTGALLAPIMTPSVWSREREGWAETAQERGHANPHGQAPSTSPGHAQHVLPEHHQREYPPSCSERSSTSPSSSRPAPPTKITKTGDASIPNGHTIVRPGNRSSRINPHTKALRLKFSRLHLYMFPPPTIFPIESQSPGRATFQDGPAFPGGSPSRLPMLGERAGVGEGLREWEKGG